MKKRTTHKIAQKLLKSLWFALTVVGLTNCSPPTVISPNQASSIQTGSSLLRVDRTLGKKPIWQNKLYTGRKHYIVQAFAYRIRWAEKVQPYCYRLKCYTIPIHAPATVPYIFIFRSSRRGYHLFAAGLVDQMTYSGNRTVRVLMRKMGFGRIRDAKHIRS